MSAPLRSLLWLLLALAALFAINLTAARLSTPALTAIWLALMMPIAYGLWARARARRSAWLAAYLHAESAWIQRLAGGPVMAVGQLLLAALLALTLLVGAVRLDGTLEWRLLLAGQVLLVALRTLIYRPLSRQVTPRLLETLTWRIAMGITAALLLLGFTLAALWQGQPDYAASPLSEAVWRAIADPVAESDLLLELLQFGATKDALAAWLGQRLIPGLGSAWFQLAGWSLLLASNGLFLWAWMNLCSGLLGLIEQRRAPALEIAR